MIGKCIEISSISEYLTKTMLKIATKKLKFLLIDIDKYILYTPSLGYFECKDVESLKELTRKILNEIDVDRVLFSKGVDEKWIEQNMKLILNVAKTQNLTLLMKPPRRDIGINIVTSSKLIRVIPLKKRRLLIKERVDPKIITEIIDLYTAILR